MRVTVTGSSRLRFADGSPVRAASAMAALGDRHLVVQDDATHGALLRPGEPAERIRLLPPVDGHETFSEAEGTKHLKPDLEAACPVPGGVLLLGSGSSPARMRWVTVRPDGSCSVHQRSATYAAAAARLGVPAEALNLEGACLVDGRLRWWQRRPAAWVDIGLDDPDQPEVDTSHRVDLGTAAGVELGVTDAVTVPGGVLLATAAEDTPNPYDDGPVVASALVLLPEGGPAVRAELPPVGGEVAKVEALAVIRWTPEGGTLLGVVDADDPEAPSLLLELEVTGTGAG